MTLIYSSFHFMVGCLTRFVRVVTKNCFKCDENERCVGHKVIQNILTKIK
jgi:hypothetical protein